MCQAILSGQRNCSSCCSSSDKKSHPNRGGFFISQIFLHSRTFGTVPPLPAPGKSLRTWFSPDFRPKSPPIPAGTGFQVRYLLRDPSSRGSPFRRTARRSDLLDRCRIPIRPHPEHLSPASRTCRHVPDRPGLRSVFLSVPAPKIRGRRGAWHRGSPGFSHPVHLCSTAGR